MTEAACIYRLYLSGGTCPLLLKLFIVPFTDASEWRAGAETLLKGDDLRGSLFPYSEHVHPHFQTLKPSILQCSPFPVTTLSLPSPDHLLLTTILNVMAVSETLSTSLTPQSLYRDAQYSRAIRIYKEHTSEWFQYTIVFFYHCSSLDTGTCKQSQLNRQMCRFKNVSDGNPCVTFSHIKL